MRKSPQPFFDDCNESSIRLRWWALPEHSIHVQFRREDEPSWILYGKVLPVPLEEAIGGESNGVQHMQHAIIEGLAEKTTYKLRLVAEKDGDFCEPSDELTIDTQAPHWPLARIVANFCSGTGSLNCRC